MKCRCLIAMSLLLVAGCGQGDNALLPELKGRWAPHKGVTARLVLASNNSSVPITAPSVKELCQSEYITFQKFNAAGAFSGAVFLHRQDRRAPTLMIAEAKREGNRIILTGQEPSNPLAGSGRARLELVLRNGEIAFDDIIDQRGRSIRYDRLKSDPTSSARNAASRRGARPTPWTPSSIRAQRAGITSIGDVYRMMFDLKPCVA